jgi:hypothetical protein
MANAISAFPVTGIPDHEWAVCTSMVSAGTRQDGEIDLMTRRMAGGPIKAEGVVSHALSTPSESGYYGVNPR